MTADYVHVGSWADMKMEFAGNIDDDVAVLDVEAADAAAVHS
jgi:hypothetical protein